MFVRNTYISLIKHFVYFYNAKKIYLLHSRDFQGTLLKSYVEGVFKLKDLKHTYGPEKENHNLQHDYIWHEIELKIEHIFDSVHLAPVQICQSDE